MNPTILICLGFVAIALLAFVVGYRWGLWVGRGDKAMKIPHRGSTSEKQ